MARDCTKNIRESLCVTGFQQGFCADHLFPILENERDSTVLVEMASSLATENAPSEIINGIQLGRMTAFQKPDGGVREIVVCPDEVLANARARVSKLEAAIAAVGDSDQCHVEGGNESRQISSS